jgi:hypothetical protein
VGKVFSDNVNDAALDYILDNISHVHILNAEPAIGTWANIASYTLGNAALIGTSFTGPADYGGGGRQIIAPATNITVGSTDTVTHLAFVDTTGEEILMVTEVVSESVTAAATYAMPSFIIYFKDPT